MDRKVRVASRGRTAVAARALAVVVAAFLALATLQSCPPAFPPLPYCVALVGDSRSDPDPAISPGADAAVYARTVAAAKAVALRIAATEAQALAHVGDFVYDGNVAAYWSLFREEYAPIIGASMPIWPAIGNHEREAALYFSEASFDWPAGEKRWYVKDHGPARFVFLDTDSPDSASYAKLSAADWSAQMTWLAATLAAAQADAAMSLVVVVMHAPVYTTGPHPLDEMGTSERAAMLSAFASCGKLKLVVGGHNHFYERSEAEGVVHLVAGGGGAPLKGRAIPAQPWSRAFASVHSYCLLRYDAAGFRLEVYDDRGALIDWCQSS